MAGKPIKRNENIVPLSRDHHSGLLFCLKVKKGLQHKTEPARVARYIHYYWETYLKQHFTEEETILFNRLDSELCNTALAQHSEIAALVTKIYNSANDDSPACAALVTLIDDHIRFEERILFPFLESALPAETLAEIGVQLKSAHTACPAEDYADEFWKI